MLWFRVYIIGYRSHPQRAVWKLNIELDDFHSATDSETDSKKKSVCLFVVSCRAYDRGVCRACTMKNLNRFVFVDGGARRRWQTANADRSLDVCANVCECVYVVLHVRIRRHMDSWTCTCWTEAHRHRTCCQHTWAQFCRWSCGPQTPIIIIRLTKFRSVVFDTQRRASCARKWNKKFKSNRINVIVCNG